MRIIVNEALILILINMILINDDINYVVSKLLLCLAGANVDSLKQGDWTSLMLAAEKRNLQIVSMPLFL